MYLGSGNKHAIYKTEAGQEKRVWGWLLFEETPKKPKAQSTRGRSFSNFPSCREQGAPPGAPPLALDRPQGAIAGEAPPTTPPRGGASSPRSESAAPKARAQPSRHAPCPLPAWLRPAPGLLGTVVPARRPTSGVAVKAARSGSISST